MCGCKCHCSLNSLQRVSSLAVCQPGCGLQAGSNQLGCGVSSRYQSAHLDTASFNAVCQPCFQLVDPAAKPQPSSVNLVANLSARLQLVRAAATFQATLNRKISSPTPLKYSSMAQLQTFSFATSASDSMVSEVLLLPFSAVVSDVLDVLFKPFLVPLDVPLPPHYLGKLCPVPFNSTQFLA